ncbi:acyl-CoA dehydrogenase family protein [Gloeothece verrucosa]|uniref:Acyl-CoA dehydrogenase domain protein n=1 Tax=Gloeothece verrucosa (strain PCC 7822) TaxID=497965 RepID=E0UCI3_GLOV7|nr:acyl-CoA dehydrogenase family protein [Gloeothece verrucosa]ADN14054.1 acyl-CoA dehydrogenase domain protein [Gloeothece verrucosa PCC 7822]
MQLEANLPLNSEEQLLQTAITYFQDIIAPQANLLDQSPQALKKALQGMGERGLLALRVPQEWGGAGVSELTYRHFQMLISRYSGALSFLQMQHQSAGSQLVASEHEALKQEYLPRMGSGEVLLGIGFSHLRRAGEPVMKATPVEGGYILSGIVPWVTGLGFFDDCIMAATLPDGQALYGVIPLREMDQPGGGQIRFSEAMELIVVGSTNTVRSELKQWFLAADRVVCIQPANAIQENDAKNVLHHGFFALGCAQAALDIVERVYYQKQLPFIAEAFNRLSDELETCRHKMLIATAIEGAFDDEGLPLRAWAINLAGRCARAAVAVSSGAANGLDHPAGRVYREALLFTVAGQTTAVMEATLEQLLC